MIDRQLLARLPLRFWIQLGLGLAVLCVVALAGFALLLAGAVIVFGLGLVFQLWSWFRPTAPRPQTQTTIEGEYKIVDRSDSERNRQN